MMWTNAGSAGSMMPCGPSAGVLMKLTRSLQTCRNTRTTAASDVEHSSLLPCTLVRKSVVVVSLASRELLVVISCPNVGPEFVAIESFQLGASSMV